MRFLKPKKWYQQDSSLLGRLQKRIPDLKPHKGRALLPRRGRRRPYTGQDILDEVVRQGLKITDLGAARLGRFIACVMSKSMTNPLPLAVARCFKDRLKEPLRRFRGRR